jgi:hypothetical protein
MESGFTAIVAVFTAILAISTVFQTCAFIASERAFVGPDSDGVKFAQDIMPKVARFAMILDLKNSGKSVAIIEDISAAITHGPLNEEPQYVKASRFTFPPIVPNGKRRHPAMNSPAQLDHRGKIRVVGDIHALPRTFQTARAASSAFASLRSRVSKPSVNHP